MRLKQLSLRGYKSFAAKTEFQFSDGITAVVGPNGSGKSNVADAILWVLGEQSMRVLRGRSTFDMIFAGGRHRAQAGMAEVSLTLDNSDGWLPIDFGEVTISRRAYRSSENEYLVNGARVRLKDISELLAESGLGQRAHAVIGQGLVDAALSLRPMERRALFEEAAGISFYRGRREEAVGRLDETERNLERVHDIVNEITPRLRRLEGERARAEEHRRITAHLERLLHTWYGYQWGCTRTASALALQRARALEANLEAKQSQLGALNNRLVQLRQGESELRNNLREWHRQGADLRDRADAVQRELAVAQERLRFLGTRQKEMSGELDLLRLQQETQAGRLDRASNEIERLRLDLVERRKQLVNVEQGWAAVVAHGGELGRRRSRLEQELHAGRGQLERLNQMLLEARESAARVASEQAVAAERVRQTEARHKEILDELQPLEDRQDMQAERVAEARIRVIQHNRDLAQRRQQLVELEQSRAASMEPATQSAPQRARVEQALRTRRAEFEQLGQALIEARAEAARLSGRIEGLHGMDASRDAAVGIQALLQAKLRGVVGPLKVLMEVPAQWESAIATALGDDLWAIVIDRVSLIGEVQRIADASGGRLVLLPLDSLRQPPPLPSNAARAADLVSCAEDVRPAVDARLGSVALCSDLTAAQSLLPEMPPGSCCATPQGIVVRADGTYSVGQVMVSGEAAGGQGRRELLVKLDAGNRRCQEMESRLETQAGGLAALETELQRLDRQAAEAREDLARVERETLSRARTEVAVAEETSRSVRSALLHETSLLDRLRTQIASRVHQATQFEAQRTGLIAGLEDGHTPPANLDAPQGMPRPDDARPQDQLDAEAVSQALSSRRREAESRCRKVEAQQRVQADSVATLAAALHPMVQEVAAAREEATRIEREILSKARTDDAVATESLRSREAGLQREKALLEQLGTLLSARLDVTAELESDRTRLLARIEQMREEASALELQLSETRRRIEPAEERLLHLADDLRTLSERERQARERARDLEARLGQGHLQVERHRDKLRLLSQRIEEDLGLVELELTESVTAQTPLPLRPLVSPLPSVEELPEGLEEEIHRLRARLRRLRSINPNAPEEYTEAKSRHQFLVEQADDLEAATTRLRQAVTELDELMAAAFRETFDAVAAEFSQTFVALFNGGRARLELTDPSRLMSSGVDIIVQPPGKRAQRLALLSSGERALTATALLFSLLRVSPTPFCVLDEVDAMLDEANVGRVRTLMEEVAHQTQFIVITHNRVTVEAADTIYGVSMGADGVSQVVSLKMD